MAARRVHVPFDAWVSVSYQHRGERRVLQGTARMSGDYLTVRTARGESSMRLDEPSLRIEAIVPADVFNVITVNLPAGGRCLALHVTAPTEARARSEAESIARQTGGRVDDVFSTDLANGVRVGGAIVHLPIDFPISTLPSIVRRDNRLVFMLGDDTVTERSFAARQKRLGATFR